jgi:hypothetical protein
MRVDFVLKNADHPIAIIEHIERQAGFFFVIILRGGQRHQRYGQQHHAQQRQPANCACSYAHNRYVLPESIHVVSSFSRRIAITIARNRQEVTPRALGGR